MSTLEFQFDIRHQGQLSKDGSSFKNGLLSFGGRLEALNQLRCRFYISKDHVEWTFEEKIFDNETVNCRYELTKDKGQSNWGYLQKKDGTISIAHNKCHVNLEGEVKVIQEPSADSDKLFQALEIFAEQVFGEKITDGKSKAVTKEECLGFEEVARAHSKEDVRNIYPDYETEAACLAIIYDEYVYLV